MTDTTQQPDFLQQLQDGIILGDGAMGTMLYASGIFINQCYDELNLSQPDTVCDIHRHYIAAGSQLIETNTFGANTLQLERYGLAEKITAINMRGVKIAREAVADSPVLIGGSIGPTGLIIEKGQGATAARIRNAMVQQADILAEAGVDVLFLETFYSLHELLIALDAVKNAVDIPVVAQFSFDPKKQEAFDSAKLAPATVARSLVEHGADVVGTNCGAGPAIVVHIVENMADAVDVPVSVFANAGTAETHAGRLLCLGTSPEYMAEYARRFAQAGASLIGGCCGTTPEMIAEMARFLKGITAEQRSRVLIRETRLSKKYPEPMPLAERSKLGSLLCSTPPEKKLISVELSPPRGIDPAKLIAGARLLKEGGVDLVNIPDGPRAVPRMGPLATASLVKNEVGIETIVHFCCRDRNLLGMQMDLLGAHALGLHNLMLITGDPPKIGGVQDASPVFDVDSIGLLQMVRNLNRGVGLADIDLHGQTQFVLGAGCNPGAIDVEEEVRRFADKIEAGAEYFFSQPVYLPELLDTFLSATADVPAVPFFIGILPLASLRNAEFLHNEVPGMQIPNEIMQRMRSAHSKEAQQEEGIRIAQDMIKQAISHPRITGIYLFPPFGRYDNILKVMEVL